MQNGRESQYCEFLEFMGRPMNFLGRPMNFLGRELLQLGRNTCIQSISWICTYGWTPERARAHARAARALRAPPRAGRVEACTQRQWA
eukprot:COSAG02_NODE_68_length_42582_cov_52.351129_30_plen_88_part_00